jgi:hypothetical protein
MGRFFLPPLADADGSSASEQAYRELRDQAEVCTGEISRERRIEGLLCRRSGRDTLLVVGQPDAGNGQTVAAIIQVGRDTYTVHHLDTTPSGRSDPLVLHRSDVYSVTDFQ